MVVAGEVLGSKRSKGDAGIDADGTTDAAEHRERIIPQIGEVGDMDRGLGKGPAPSVELVGIRGYRDVVGQCL